MKHFLSLLLLVVVTGSSAQNGKIKFGISSSLDLNSYMFVDDLGAVGDYISYKGRLSYSLGMLMHLDINERIALKSGVSYSNKSFTEIIDFSKLPDDPILRDDDKIRIIHSTGFIDLPLDVHFGLSSSGTVEPYFILGVVNSFRVGYKRKAEHDYGGDSEGIKYNPYLLSSKVGFGFLIKQSKIALALEPQVRFYLTEVHDHFLTENPVYFGLEVGVLKL